MFLTLHVYLPLSSGCMFSTTVISFEPIRVWFFSQVKESGGGLLLLTEHVKVTLSPCIIVSVLLLVSPEISMSTSGASITEEYLVKLIHCNNQR